MSDLLDLRMDESAKQEIGRRLEAAADDHVLAIMQFLSPEDPDGIWDIGFYTPAQIEPTEKMLERTGQPLRYRVEGFDFVIEPHFAQILKGKLLQFSDGEFSICDPRNKA